MTLEQYNDLFAMQDGRCAICLNPPKENWPLDVDHDHKSGRVRALLCNNCNRGIGHLQDDPDLLEAAAAYLREHKNAESLAA